MTHRFTLLSAPELSAALAETRRPVLVDVRDREAFELGHVPGSLHIPVYDLGARRQELPASLAARLVIVGDHRKRAEAAATFLTLIGFGDVSILDGGIATWDGTFETGPPPPPASSGPELRVIPSDDGD